jgi:hypothetical protein
LQAVKDRTGAPIAEQVRRAIVVCLQSNGVKLKGVRPGGQSRRDEKR